MSYVLTGVMVMDRKKVAVRDLHEQTVKVFGPFETEDAAREFANGLGLSGVRWNVVPLRSPVPNAL